MGILSATRTASIHRRGRERADPPGTAQHGQQKRGMTWPCHGGRNVSVGLCVSARGTRVAALSVVVLYRVVCAREPGAVLLASGSTRMVSRYNQETPDAENSNVTYVSRRDCETEDVMNRMQYYETPRTLYEHTLLSGPAATVFS